MKKAITAAAAVIAASLIATWFWRFRKKQIKEGSLEAENIEVLSRSEVP